VKAASRILAIAAAFVLSGCSTLGYYAQAVEGHLALMRRSQPIHEVIARSGTPQALRAKLERVLAMREFASRELSLPDNASYTNYAAIDRPFVVWNVFAAPEFSVHAQESCFPVAGCVNYRGFYSETDAKGRAAQLRAQGLDTFVGGVPAYSTLGWFDDPVLSTFINFPEPEVARIIFHELAHQVAYAAGDTVFNESFAVAVEQEGVKRWLAMQGSDAQRKSWEDLQARRREFIGLVRRYRDRLDRLYTQPGSVEEKRTGKLRLFGQMREDYQSLKASWGGFAGFDRFFEQGASNALLAAFTDYTELVPEFAALLARCQGDLVAFYAEVRKLAREAKIERRESLRLLAQGSGGAATAPGSSS
jgi:predicted aminopeptidase